MDAPGLTEDAFARLELTVHETFRADALALGYPVFGTFRSAMQSGDMVLSR